MSADARERKTFSLFRTCALALTLRVFLPKRSAKISSSFIRTSFNGTIITVSTKMVYSLPCFLFVSFFFVFGRFCVSCGPAFSASKTKTHARTFFLKRAQVCAGVDTVIVFARIFGAHFFVSFLTFQFLYFCLLFFGETFGHRASAFLSFLIINMGGPEKKHNSFLSTRRIGLCNE